MIEQGSWLREAGDSQTREKPRAAPATVTGEPCPTMPLARVSGREGGPRQRSGEPGDLLRGGRSAKGRGAPIASGGGTVAHSVRGRAMPPALNGIDRSAVGV